MSDCYTYRWEFRDRELNNAVVLDEYEDYGEPVSIEYVATQVRVLEPFLKKYSLDISLFDQNEKKVDLSTVKIPRAFGYGVEVYSLPGWSFIKPTYPLWIKSYPWLMFLPSENERYPLYWVYSREVRSLYPPEKPWMNNK